MENNFILKIDDLLVPIPSGQPSGNDLRRDFNSNFHALKDAREAARSAEKAEEELAAFGDNLAGGAGHHEGGSSTHWRCIYDLSQQVLQNESKDLQIVAWLVESLVRLHTFHHVYRERSFAGLRDGFNLLRGLVETVWEDLYPQEDEDGVKTRVRPITALNGEDRDGVLIEPLRKIPITAGPPPFSLWEYLLALESRDGEETTHPISYANLEHSAQQTPAEFFWVLLSDLQGCRSELDHLAQVLREKAGSEHVHTSRLHEVLSQIHDAVRHVCHQLAGYPLEPPTHEAEPALETEFVESLATPGDAADIIDNPIPSPEHKSSTQPSPVAANATFMSYHGPIQDREDAFRRLEEIAQFFESQEPQSPISYTLREVVRRGRLPLFDLLQELIQDDESRIRFLERSGIQPPTEEDQTASSDNW